jgi:hypothetical protein
MNSSNVTTELSDCGCCKGISAETPVELQNRPGLSAIAYRVGTHSTFRETLHARLSGSGQPALNGLTTRDNNDFSIALLDAWAMVGDVLTFYTERVANEAYLRTATERLSVLELARLINYELRPGVAAGTYLAFTIEDTPGAGGQALAIGTSAQVALELLPPIKIAAGVKVQSIPGPGEQAQTFETTEEIEARPEWNAIKPRLTQPQTKSSFWSKSLFFEGTANDLKKGDQILLLSGGNTLPLPRKVLNVTTDDEAKTTRVDFDLPTAALPAYQRPAGLPEGEVDEFAPKTPLSKEVTQQIIGEKWKEEDLAALISTQRWNANALTTNIKNEIAEQTKNAQPQAFVYREKAAVFGYNAPKKPVYKGNVPDDPENWAEWSLDPSEDEKLIYLDRAYEAITPGSYITVRKGKLAKTIQVVDVTTEPRTAYSISSKSTLLTLAESWWTILPEEVEFGRKDRKGKKQKLVSKQSRSTRDLGDLRDVAVYVQSESVPLSQLPIDTPLRPNNVLANGVTLDGPYFGLKSGQRIVLKGEKDTLRGVYGSETLTLKTVEVEAGFTVVTFNESLAYPYVRKTVTINANVAAATHGETVAETLGGGDATQAFQRFTLKQPPLTYISASTATGAASTLEVRVNDVLWTEVPDFFGHGPEERIYTTQLDDNGNTTVIFGDGVTGARLPTGLENVKAKYRKGIGLGGLVKADQLTQLMTRPFGVKGVTNPLAASGAADREQLEEARRNAPLTVLTLGRIVSLQDYEDFARTFSGIDKALATWTWFGEKRGVFVTIAGPGGAEVTESSELYNNLVSAMGSSGNLLVPLQVKSYQSGLFRVTASLKIDPAYIPEKVLADAEQKLRDEFSFENRSFGQPVHLSEVFTVLQQVTGVIAVNITALYRSNESSALNQHIAAAVPLPTRTQVLPAEILTLDSQPLNLGTFQ